MTTMYVNNGDLTADEVCVVGEGTVQQLVAAGWRILGVVHTTVPRDATGTFSLPDGGNGQLYIPGSGSELRFIMGRSGEAAGLHGRLLAAESEAREAKDAVAAIEAEVDRLKSELVIERRNVEEAKAHNGDLQVRAHEAEGRHGALVREVGTVRREIGEARWREIVGSLEVEQVLEGKAPAGDDSADSGVPF